MRPAEIHPGFAPRPALRHDLAAAFVVGVLMAAIIVAGFAALLLKAGGAL